MLMTACNMNYCEKGNFKHGFILVVLSWSSPCSLNVPRILKEALDHVALCLGFFNIGNLIIYVSAYTYYVHKPARNVYIKAILLGKIFT